MGYNPTARKRRRKALYGVSRARSRQISKGNHWVKNESFKNTVYPPYPEKSRVKTVFRFPAHARTHTPTHTLADIVRDANPEGITQQTTLT